MSAEHGIGPISGVRQGSYPILQTIPLAYTDGTARKALTIEASATKPVLMQVGLAVGTVYNAATTNTFSVGSTSGATQFVNAAAVPTVAGTAAWQTTLYLLTARTDIWVKFGQTGTAATTGAGHVLLKIAEVNVDRNAK